MCAQYNKHPGVIRDPHVSHKHIAKPVLHAAAVWLFARLAMCRFVLAARAFYVAAVVCLSATDTLFSLFLMARPVIACTPTGSP